MRVRDYIYSDPAADLRAIAAAALAATKQDQRAGLFALINAARPDTPASKWSALTFAQLSNPEKSTRWKAKSLGIDPAQKDIDIALSGMAPMQVGDNWHLAIAWPAPKPLHGLGHEPHQLVIIDPASAQASLYGVHEHILIGARDEANFAVHANPVQWAIEYATARLEWFYARRNAKRQADIEPHWHGLPPTALAIGDLEKIAWPAADVIQAGPGIDSTYLAKLVRRQFHSPRVQNNQMRRAA